MGRHRLVSWHILSGHVGDVDLTDLRAVLSLRYRDDVEPTTLWECVLYVDESGPAEQRDALAAIFLGRAGGSVPALYGPAIGAASTTPEMYADVLHSTDEKLRWEIRGAATPPSRRTSPTPPRPELLGLRGPRHGGVRAPGHGRSDLWRQVGATGLAVGPTRRRRTVRGETSAEGCRWAGSSRYGAAVSNLEMDVVVMAMRALRAGRAALNDSEATAADVRGAKAIFDSVVADLRAADRPELMLHVAAMLAVVALSDSGDQPRARFVDDYIENALFNATTDDLTARG